MDPDAALAGAGRPRNKSESLAQRRRLSRTGDRSQQREGEVKQEADPEREIVHPSRKHVVSIQNPVAFRFNNARITSSQSWQELLDSK